MTWNVEAAVGFPRSASSTVKTFVTDTAGHATFTGGGFYEFCSPKAMQVVISTDDTSATTNTGMYIPADVVYSFYIPSTHLYVSFINAVADEGAVNVTITPKSHGPA